MTQNIAGIPASYPALLAATRSLGFSMASDVQTCALLRTLTASKGNGRFLELGTGTGLSTSWILDGMGSKASLVSVDNDAACLDIARHGIGDDYRLTLIETDAGKWITDNAHLRFDFIFADTWAGKYLFLPETLAMLSEGAFYVIDDMLPQPNWPEGHAEKADALLKALEQRQDLALTKLDWSTGIIVAVKR